MALGEATIAGKSGYVAHAFLTMLVFNLTRVFSDRHRSGVSPNLPKAAGPSVGVAPAQ
jgi:hypothetical protein